MKNVFYLKWKDHRLVLCESTDQTMIEDLSDGNIAVSYGENLLDEDLSFIKSELKIKIEKSVNRWINDSRFLIHLLMSAGVFLVAYYFLSYVIRDPLPIVDEIILSLLMGGLAWHRLKNQQYQSDKVIHKKVEMEQYLNDLDFNKSDFLAQVELYLEKLSSMSSDELKNLINSGGVPVFFTSEKKQLVKLLKLMELNKRTILFRRGSSFPGELNEMIKQIRSFLKYHSSMV